MFIKRALHMPWGKPSSWGVIDLRAGWHTTFQNDLRFLVTSLRTLEGKGPGPNSHQFPPLQCFSEPVRCCVYCNSARRQCGVPAVSSWLLRPWNSPPPTHTHRFADLLWETLSQGDSSYVQNSSAFSSAQVCQASRLKHYPAN